MVKNNETDQDVTENILKGKILKLANKDDDIVPSADNSTDYVQFFRGFCG